MPTSGIAIRSGLSGVWPMSPAAKPAKPAPSASRPSSCCAGTSFALGFACMSTNCAKRNSIPSSATARRTSSARRASVACLDVSHICRRPSNGRSRQNFRAAYVRSPHTSPRARAPTPRPLALVLRLCTNLSSLSAGGSQDSPQPMSFLLICPNCGEREVTDFAYGGEVVPRPATKPSERELNAYNYFRRNVAGVQREWWYHRSGCRAWFLAERDTTTNEVHWVGLPGAMSRLPPSPASGSTASGRLSFSFDGKPIEAFEGDTIGSALHAGGHRVLSRSFKYHRPRGLLCCAGQCPNCLVDVDGWPGVRACTEPVREGMKVKHMNASAVAALRRSCGRTDIFGKPSDPARLLLQDLHQAAAAVAALREGAAQRGRPRQARRRQAEREWRTEYRRRRADVLVVGGGVAGMAAALRAAELGADVVLADDGPELGGALLAGEGAGRRARAGGRGSAQAGVEVLAPAAALGFFDGIVPVWCESTLHQVRADRHIAATGSIEQPLMFEGNDLPGRDAVLGRAATGRALRRRARQGRGRRHDRRPRPRVGARAAATPGSRSTAIADARAVRRRAGNWSRGSRRAGIPLLRGTAVVRACGRRQVRGAVVAELDPAGRWLADTERGIDCDLVAVSGGTVPATSLLLQAGGQGALGRGRRRLPARRGCPPGIYAAGAVAGHGLAESGGRSRARSRERRPRSRSSSASRPTARGSNPSGPALAERRRAPRPVGADGRAGSGARARKVLRLPVRGRDHQGHQLRDRRGVRLPRAAQALHDGDHGAVPGADVPARLDPADGGDTGRAVAGDRPDDRQAARGRPFRWGCSRAGRSSRPSARRSTDATASSGAMCSGPATGAGPTTTAIRGQRRWPCTRAPA